MLMTRRIRLTKRLTLRSIGLLPYLLNKKNAGTFPNQLAPIIIAVPLLAGTPVSLNIYAE